MAATLYSVDDVVRKLGVTPRTLHYYEEMGLIAPSERTTGGHRMYDEAVVERIAHILRLKDHLGYSLNDIRAVVRVEDALDRLRASYRAQVSPIERAEIVQEARELISDVLHHIDDKLDRLQALRESYAGRLQKVQQLQAQDEASTGGGNRR
jgi:DNA-binding transcriptional MerR regulator